MKKVLVTGGSKGIGLSIVRLFAENGYETIAVARDFSRSETGSGKVRKIEFDLSQTEKIPELVKKIGKVDILVNNAGMMNSLPYDNYPEKKKRQLVALNIETPVALIREYAPIMIGNGGGRIVNVASIAGEIGHPDIWYGITKAGVINMTKSFAKILGSKGIVINCVAPGPTEGTPMFGVIPPARKKELKRSTFSGRFAKSAEIAETVFWLAGQSPDYINGICIDVNNGAFLR